MSEDRSAGVLQDGLEALARRVEELNTELAAVRRELREQRLQATEYLVPAAREELGSASADPSVVTSLAVDQPEMSRRNALRAAGVLAAGAVAMRHARRSRRTASARCVRASVNIPAPNGAATCILGFR